MPVLEVGRSVLLVIDLQAKLMPAIEDGAEVLRNAGRLIAAARLLGVEVVFTEQNPRGLGPTVAELGAPAEAVLTKMSFDALADPDVAARIGGAQTVVLIGCEAHVCVLQTALALRARGRAVALVADACGSRRGANQRAALERARDHGADVMTTEMVLFEWLGSATHPAFRDVLALVK